MEAKREGLNQERGGENEFRRVVAAACGSGGFWPSGGSGNAAPVVAYGMQSGGSGHCMHERCSDAPMMLAELMEAGWGIQEDADCLWSCRCTAVLGGVPLPASTPSWLLALFFMLVGGKSGGR